VPDIAAQQAWEATLAAGAWMQHAGRLAASTGAKTSEAKIATASFRGFVMTTREVKIPTGTPTVQAILGTKASCAKMSFPGKGAQDARPSPCSPWRPR
jgi:hypothetical protein